MNQEAAKVAYDAWRVMSESTYKLWDAQRKATTLLNQAAFGVPDPQCLHIFPHTQDGSPAGVHLKERHSLRIWPQHLRALAAEALAAADFFDLLNQEQK